MKFLRGTLGYCIAGIFVMALSGQFAKKYGIGGGWFVSFITLGILWFMNHYLCLIHHEKEAAFVDMTLGIGICGIMRDTFIHGSEALISSLPTLSIVIAGGILGGLVASLIKINMADDN
ncbi:hypothetical protein KQI89_12330 [Clostridium sp. MSJ-4]|uniref:Uncharacterized protein n=1 Tax=Clostridium simiarum TaxID=2841506 RepID=A0ABS6F225_9CLOT|nr:hypothetical protein [Clostridium simiarum]MBU5592543.1 hypothetical protein [Clostridium simiarum]